MPNKYRPRSPQNADLLKWCSHCMHQRPPEGGRWKLLNEGKLLPLYAKIKSVGEGAADTAYMALDADGPPMGVGRLKSLDVKRGEPRGKVNFAVGRLDKAGLVRDDSIC